MPDSNRSTRQAQLRSLEGAQNWGLEWDAADIELLAEFGEVTAEELAETLGRSVYAVQSARERLAQGQLGGGHDRNRKPARRAAPVYTFIDGDTPPDW